MLARLFFTLFGIKIPFYKLLDIAFDYYPFNFFLQGETLFYIMPPVLVEYVEFLGVQVFGVTFINGVYWTNYLPLIAVKTIVMMVLRGVKKLSGYTEHPRSGPFLFFLELGFPLEE
jgi:hypothetical protein